MDQARALNALAQYVALAKSATSPQAAADLVTRATRDPNAYVFAELVQQKNIQALKGHSEYGSYYQQLEIFSHGTWSDYKSTSGLPPLNDAQALKLRLLSLLTIGSEKPTAAISTQPDLSYTSLCSRLDLASPIDLEHLITQAIYSNLLTAMLNPAARTVVITSVAPLRDLAPGSITTMMAELEAWSARCTAVLGDLETEIARVKADAAKRATREARVERQVRAVVEAAEKSTGSVGGGGTGLGRGGHNVRGGRGKDTVEEDDDEDAMDVDGAGGGRKKGGTGFGGLMGKLAGAKGNAR